MAGSGSLKRNENETSAKSWRHGNDGKYGKIIMAAIS